MSAFGLFTIGGFGCALPVGLVREVVPAPPKYFALPATNELVLGAIEVRGQVIPVCDPGRAMTAGGGTTTNAIAVLVHDGRMAAIAVDAVDGLIDIADDVAQEMVALGEPAPLTRSCFLHPLTGEIVSILDGATLFSLPGLPTAPEVDRRRHLDTATLAMTSDGANGARTTLLFDVGATPFAVDAEPIVMVLPTLDVAHSVLESTLVRGVVDFQGSHVPVVDLLTLVGLGATPPDAMRHGIVLRAEGGHVVLAISSVTGINAVVASELMEPPALTHGATPFVRALLQTAGSDEPRFVLADADIVTDDRIVALGHLNVEIDTTERATASTGSRSADQVRRANAAKAAIAGRSYLAYDIGTTITTSLDEIDEIVALPDSITAPSGAPSYVLGTIVHRDKPAPLVDLGALTRGNQPLDLADADTARTVRVLLVDHDGRVTGFVVNGLRAIVRSVWEDTAEPSNATASRHDPASALRDARLVEVLDDAGAALIPVVGLQDLVERLQPYVADCSAGSGIIAA